MTKRLSRTSTVIRFGCVVPILGILEDIAKTPLARPASLPDQGERDDQDESGDSPGYGRANRRHVRRRKREQRAFFREQICGGRGLWPFLCGPLVSNTHGAAEIPACAAWRGNVRVWSGIRKAALHFDQDQPDVTGGEIGEIAPELAQL
jgi:hypothetical protein